MTELLEFELSKEFLERFSEAIENQEVDFIQGVLDGVNPVDITTLLYEFDSEESKFVIDLLPKEIGAQIINDLDEDTQTKFLKIFPSVEIAEYVNEMDSDDAADLLNELPIKQREEVIFNLIDQKKKQYILDLLRYEEDSAGGLMAKELIRVKIGWNIKQCIDEIRSQAEQVTKVYYAYVVDDNEKLLGRVSLKSILLENDNTVVGDIYDSDIVTVETHMDEEEVAEIMRKYDLDAVPVVNVLGRLVGRITIDDVVDVITEQAEEERQIMSGISSDVEEDDSVWMLSRARLPWLIVGLFGGLLGAKFIGLFEQDIALIPALAFFIPLITATGGNVGIQSSSLVVQSLANKSAFDIGILKRLGKVLLVALVNGVVLSGLVFFVNMFVGSSENIATVVAIALFTVVLLASVMGTITPIILDKFGVNPALASGPFITTANDLLGLATYFFVAHLLYN